METLKKHKKPIIIALVVTLALVSLCCIAFFALSAFGISRANSAAFDTQRRAGLAQLNLTVQYEYSLEGSVPETLDFEEETFGGTDYCYQKLGNAEYKLGVKLGSGEWFNLGTDDC